MVASIYMPRYGWWFTHEAREHRAHLPPLAHPRAHPGLPAGGRVGAVDTGRPKEPAAETLTMREARTVVGAVEPRARWTFDFRQRAIDPRGLRFTMIAQSGRRGLPVSRGEVRLEPISP